MQYGQGMVRPGCWFNPRGSGGWLDRQYRIATGVHSFHYDISSYWENREVTPEARRDFGSLFVATSPDLSSVWWVPTHSRWTSTPITPVWCPVLEGSWSGGRDA
jgi:hypothetical protein